MYPISDIFNPFSLILNTPQEPWFSSGITHLLDHLRGASTLSCFQSHLRGNPNELSVDSLCRDLLVSQRRVWIQMITLW